MVYKLEGTTQTWGQLFVPTANTTNLQSPNTTSTVKSGYVPISDSSTAEFTTGTPAGGNNVPSTNMAGTTTSSPASSYPAPGQPPPPPPISSNVPDNSEPVDGQLPVIPVDTVVEVIRNTITAVGDSNLGCKAASTVAMAAVSSNKSATAVINDDQFFLDSAHDILLQASVLANVSTVAPKVSKTIVVLGSSVNTKETIKKALTESQKVDLSITLRSKRSEQIEFNNLKRLKLRI